MDQNWKHLRTENAGSRKDEIGRLENIVGKGENAGNQHFLIFPQCFSPILMTISVLFSLVTSNFSSSHSVF